MRTRWPPEHPCAELRSAVSPSLLTSMPASQPAFDYPNTERGPVAEAQFGEQVADPFRWLENDVRTDQRGAQLGHRREPGDLRLPRYAARPGDALYERLSAAVGLRALRRAGESRRQLLLFAQHRGCRTRPCCSCAPGSRARRANCIDPNSWAEGRRHGAGGVGAARTMARSWPPPCRTAAPTGARSRCSM